MGRARAGHHPDYSLVSLSLSKFLLNLIQQALILFSCANSHPALYRLQGLLEVLFEDRVVLAHREVAYALHLDELRALDLVGSALAVLGRGEVIVLPVHNHNRAPVAVYLI